MRHVRDRANGNGSLGSYQGPERCSRQFIVMPRTEVLYGTICESYLKPYRPRIHHEDHSNSYASNTRCPAESLWVRSRKRKECQKQVDAG